MTLDPRRPVVMTGSCFADNISARMRAALWQAENPFGTLYNPLSIARVLRTALLDSEGEERFRRSLFESQGMVRSWLFDSRFAAERSDDCCIAFNRASSRIRELLGRAQAMCVTFGTSWCYFLGDEVVSNCHKQPAAIFERRRITVGEIVNVWEGLIGDIRKLYPELQFIFTVSPVRHMKDGFAGNSHSKAVLLLAVEELCSRMAGCHYFPAYEIMNDDLRDYRFYASDLVHPSDEGVEYIWEKFRETFLDEAGERRVKEGESIERALGHRPLPNAIVEPSEQRVTAERERREELLAKRRAFLLSHG